MKLIRCAPCRQTAAAPLAGTLFVEYWPTAEDEPVADAVNSTPKIVFSSTLDSAPWGDWKPARVLNGSAVDHVHQLRRKPSPQP